ncbi:kinase-like domain-containing protein [Collybia nuda]|uniref:Kinase-like domain-containing protein n=1 Tax=Collybia nuda TaxID=64659 RepID=A0A9P5XYW6_9AGAR|nr:kinase-like domain-containing protein [Collybia nuda]
MNLPESSEYLPLQAYHGCVSSAPAPATRVTIQSSSSFRYGPAPISKDDELGILRVVGRNNIPIVPLADIQLASTNWQTDAQTRSGLAMHVHRGTWGGQSVALKRVRKHMFNEGGTHSQENAMRHSRAILDLGFELQIMSKPSLRRHRNIITLLAITFDLAWTSDADPTGELTLPILVVEHADTRFPDLGLFFNPQHNPTLPTRLSFEVSASLIADIADGIVALHGHDLVHADLKPTNILIFPDNSIPCGLIAKVADFGLSGMTTYRSDGLRVPGRDPPRGGTTEWNAPECAGEVRPPVFVKGIYQEQPHELPSRDVYSFGLLASYIALDGQTPGSYVQDLAQVKKSDGIIDAVRARLEIHHREDMDDSGSIGSLVSTIVNMTLSLDHEKRTKHLDNIRQLLFGSNPYEHEHPTPTKFVLNFNLIPNSLHEFKREGLYRAYWQSPPGFREHVRKCFLNFSSGLPQYVSPDIMRCLEEPDINDVVVERIRDSNSDSLD